jgi:hypothetical protein
MTAITNNNFLMVLILSYIHVININHIIKTIRNAVGLPRPTQEPVKNWQPITESQ